ncbi:Kelch repeat-containing protein [Arenimonas fontis]|uniref:Galactose oxidase n=1 Tax=Arenimonas fontis TaxID=2608255 RepID=A0A5B2ZBQ8_9GAMM|nr:kelch repeat-containing protein [Arenimonas fontis]KAA2285345.1 hypothetical protein F0415_05355 [Arenimonas fontis]
MKTLVLAAAGVIAVIGTAVVTKQESVQADRNLLRVVQIDEMSTARAAHQAVLLGSGEVLITGGCSGGCDTNLRSTELYEPSTRVFRPAAAMATARSSHVAVPLTDGRVLVAGGWSERRATRSAEIYDPGSNRFVAAGGLTVERAAPTASRLPDGRVLIAGGQTSEFEPLASAELFDPSSSSFSSTASMSVPRVGHAAVSLADGRVLITGGRIARRGEILYSAEIFDPSTNQFQPTGDMSSPRHKHAAALLPDGRVLVVGGSDVRDQRGRYRSSEIYDPATGEFTDGPDMSWPRFKLPHAVAVLPSGAVLVAGGAARLELYAPGSQTFVPVEGELSGPREFATASLLPSGEVLVLGGYDEQIRVSASSWLVRVP